MNEDNFKRKNEFKYRNRHMPINDDMFITPRLLLSIIRCSQALVRIYSCNKILNVGENSFEEKRGAFRY